MFVSIRKSMNIIDKWIALDKIQQLVIINSLNKLWVKPSPLTLEKVTTQTQTNTKNKNNF